MITLNQAEQKLAKYLAEARHKNARSKNITNAKIGPQSNLQTDLEGVAAEIAFCKIMNVYPDLETFEGMPDADAYHPRFGAVDVKSTTYANGRLLARPTKEGKAIDTFALMVGTFPNYRFVGWIPAKDFLTDAYLGDLGKGPTYIADQSQLKE